MQKFGRVMTVIDWLFAVAGGIVLIVVVALLDREGSINLGRVAGPAVTVGVAMILLNLVWLALAIKGLGREEFVTSESEGGQVNIAVSAIEESLTRTALAQPEVSGARTHVALGADRKSPTRIVANVTFVETPDQVGAQQVLQEALLKRFREVVSIVQEVPVDINVVRFVAEKRPSSEKKQRGDRDRTLGKEGETEPFRGPRYPVGG